jgi:hypothetical protein
MGRVAVETEVVDPSSDIDLGVAGLGWRDLGPWLKAFQCGTPDMGSSAWVKEPWPWCWIQGKEIA